MAVRRERERERERERVAKLFILPNLRAKLFVFLTLAPIFVLCFSFNAHFLLLAQIYENYCYLAQTLHFNFLKIFSHIPYPANKPGLLLLSLTRHQVKEPVAGHCLFSLNYRPSSSEITSFSSFVPLFFPDGRFGFPGGRIFFPSVSLILLRI